MFLHKCCLSLVYILLLTVGLTACGGGGGGDNQIIETPTEPELPVEPEPPVEPYDCPGINDDATWNSYGKYEFPSFSSSSELEPIGTDVLEEILANCDWREKTEGVKEGTRQIMTADGSVVLVWTDGELSDFLLSEGWIGSLVIPEPSPDVKLGDYYSGPFEGELSDGWFVIQTPAIREPLGYFRLRGDNFDNQIIGLATFNPVE